MPPGGLYPVYLQDLFNFRSTMYNLRDSEIKLDLRTLLDALKGKFTNITTTIRQAPTRQSCKTDIALPFFYFNTEDLTVYTVN